MVPPVHSGVYAIKYQNLLNKLVNSGKIVGAQLCVLSNGLPGGDGSEKVINIAAGHCGFTCSLPCDVSTRFPAVGISQLPLLLLVRKLLDSGTLNAKATLADMWPEVFAESTVTVEMLLTHTFGINGVLPPAVALSAPDIVNWDRVLECLKAKVQQYTPTAVTDTSTGLCQARDSGLVHGWVLTELCLRATGRTVAPALNASGSQKQTAAPDANLVKEHSQHIRDALGALYDAQVRTSLAASSAAAAAGAWLSAERGGTKEAQPHLAVLSNHLVAEAKELAAANGMSTSEGGAGGAGLLGGALLGTGKPSKASRGSSEEVSSEDASSDSLGLGSLFKNYLCDFGLVRWNSMRPLQPQLVMC